MTILLLLVINCKRVFSKKIEKEKHFLKVIQKKINKERKKWS